MKTTLTISSALGPDRVLHPDFERFEVHVDILRLDRIHPLLSGNKWLKLSGWLSAAPTEGVTGIATMGGPWSNHLHAVAAFCHHKRISCRLYINSEMPVDNAMINDAQSWGAEIIWTSREAFASPASLKEKAEADGYLWVPMGGDGLEGILGVKDFFNVMNLPAYDEIWCAVGTGTTLAGMLASGLQAGKWVGYCPGFGKQSFAALQEKFEPWKTNHDVGLVNDVSLRFGQSNDELIAFMNQFYDITGIPADLVYTGRLLHYLLQHMRMLVPAPGSRILVVHTGGLQGNRSVVDNRLKF